MTKHDRYGRSSALIDAVVGTSFAGSVVSSRPAVVTGVGIISSLGRGREATLDAVRTRRSGIRKLTGLEPDDEVKPDWIGGQVDDDWLDRFPP